MFLLTKVAEKLLFVSFEMKLCFINGYIVRDGCCFCYSGDMLGSKGGVKEVLLPEWILLGESLESYFLC